MFLSLAPVWTILFLTLCQVQSNILLETFNTIFLDTYQQVRNNLLTTIEPLMIINGDTLMLKYRGEQKSMPINQKLYHNLKTISHIPFSIYLSIFNVESNNRNLSRNELIKLRSYLHKIRTIRTSLNISDFASNLELFHLQFNIIDLSTKFIRSLIRSKQVNMTALRDFCHNATNLFSINIRHAAHAQLNELHRVVYQIYRKRFNETERKTVQIVILGPKAPREGFVIKQYFEKLLGGQNLEGKRILYAENIVDEQTALNVLGSWLLDAHSAKAFFNDETRLHRDLLMDAAMSYIQNLF